MTRERFTHIAAVTAAAGGAAWVAKFVVVAVTDGGTTDTGAAAALFVLGVALMAAGSTWVGVKLAGRAPLAVAILLALLSPLLLFVTFVILESVAKAIVGDAGPWWLADEAGILATGATWLVASMVRPTERRLRLHRNIA